MDNILVVGAGGHGQVVRETLIETGMYGKISFLDDDSKLAIGKIEEFKKFVSEYRYIFVAIGDAKIRTRILNEVKPFFEIPTIVHNRAYVAPSAKIGYGCYIGAMAVVNSNSIIKNGCIVDIGALVGHNSYVDDYVYVKAGEIVNPGEKRFLNYYDNEYSFDAGV